MNGSQLLSIMYCPVCGSEKWHPQSSYNSGFSVGKAAAGAFLFGPIGAIAGATGKKKTLYRCDKCGYTKEMDG